MNRIKASIPLLVNPVTKKSTFNSPGVKFGANPLWKMNIHYTPKNTRRKGMIGGDGDKGTQSIKGCFVMKGFVWETISEICSSGNSF